MRIKLKSDISMGELLTSLSILISLTALLINWNKDRQIEVKRQSAAIKELSIQAFSNVVFWKDLNLHFFDRADVTIKDAARLFALNKKNILTRDLFAKEINQIRNEIDYEILQKDLKTFHFKLLNYGLDPDSTFIRTITYINTILEINYKDYQQDTERIILSEEIPKTKETAILGDKLRSINNVYRRKTKDLFKLESTKLQDYLHSIIIKTDQEIFYHK